MGTRDYNLEVKILDTIKKYSLIEPNDIVIIAVSGGPDSMCLLNSIYNLKDKLEIDKIIVAHVNHMLREEAEEETQYVKEYCKNKNIKFYAKYVNIKEISENNKISEEMAGREARYSFFEEIASLEHADKIAIAHNYNDNAETVLMHLLRGTGISGLVGIRPYREGKFIRPIIKCDRQEIEKYCEKNNLNPKYDKSNYDNTYTRNKIRNELLPYLKKEFNPNIIDTLNRLSELVLVQEDFINEITEESYNDICIEETENKIILDLKKFNNLNETIRSNIIIYTIKKIFGSSIGIEKVHLDDIMVLCSKNIGNKYLTPNKNMKVFVKSRKVSFEKVLK